MHKCFKKVNDLNTFAILTGPKICTKTMHKVLIRSVTGIHYKPKFIFPPQSFIRKQFFIDSKGQQKNKGQVNFFKKTIKIYTTLSL